MKGQRRGFGGDRLTGKTTIGVGVAEDIGSRDHMEDTFAVLDLPERGFLSAEVYDGHGGIGAARVAAEMVTPCFLHLLDQSAKAPEDARTRPAELIRDAYCAVDRSILDQGIGSGATAATFYIMGDTMLAANAGDSRVVVGTKTGPVQLTEDHRAGVRQEVERIERLGGRVIHFGTPRVQGILAVSRSLGDFLLKPFVVCEPRVVEGLLGRENDYAVVACDGVWDVLSPEEAIEVARLIQNPQEAAQSIIAKALSEGGTDNMTVIVLDLRNHTRRLDREKMKISRIIDWAVPGGHDPAP